MIYKFVSFILQKVYGNAIVGKYILGFDKKLYYEPAQHLTFFINRKINYESQIWLNIIPFLKNSKLIFDIGGNIGQYAVRFSEMVGNEGKVFSFEPDYKCFSFLQFNININRCTNVTCLNNGIGEKNEVVEFFRDTKTGGRMGSFDRQFVKDKFKGHIDLIKIEMYDEIIKKYGILDFVKIDIEGLEHKVVNNIEVLAARTIFLIEVRNSTKVDIYKKFNKNNFLCYIVDGKFIQEARTLDEIPSFANLLFVSRQHPNINSLIR